MKILLCKPGIKRNAITSRTGLMSRPHLLHNDGQHLETLRELNAERDLLKVEVLTRLLSALIPDTGRHCQRRLVLQI